MKINEKKNISRISKIDDKHISQDFSKIFDATENVVDIGTLSVWPST